MITRCPRINVSLDDLVTMSTWQHLLDKDFPR
ncbi:unnamed protein product [Spirodela intermedia]|uniref:Uncharacterized protein n=1 Tax=Spirodela intermedia TaxID=51605 RepID=A0A7I8L2S0_SPIIN|nr:unnamed protein product [Spirodela intermedia]